MHRASFLLFSPTLASLKCSKTHRSHNESNSDPIEKLRPSPLKYERIDELLSSTHKSWMNGNLVHDTLNGPGMIERYEVYKSLEENEVLAIVTFGKKVNGHKGIVHGGMTSAMIDNTYGWLFTSMNTPPAFTANLNVNFRCVSIA